MARDIDERKKAKALRKLRKAAERAEAEGGPGLSDWEREFVDEVGTRVEKYGSAFADPDKGNLDEPLSALQTRKLKEIDKKSRGKDTGSKKRAGFKSSFKPKTKNTFTPRGRDINDDIEDDNPVAPQAPTKPTRPALVRAAAKDKAPPAPPAIEPDAKPDRKPPVFTLIKGGKDT